MSHAVTIPKLGLTMEEATFVEWLRPDGAAVTKGTPIFAIETDKISSEVEADRDGILRQVATVDAVLPVGALVGYLDDGSGAAPAPAVPDAGAASATPARLASEAVPAPAATPVPALAHAASLAVGTAAGGRLLVSPVARRIATERRVDLDALRGSGPGGVILMRDVEGATPAASGAASPAEVPPAPRPAAPPSGVPAASASALGDPVASRRPLAGIRKAVAQRMMQSLSGSAQMTGFGKIDMTEAVRLRGELVAAADTLGTRITFTDMILKACAQALREMPDINASIVGDEIVTWSEVDIGLAVAIDDGLIVPVLRGVDRLSLVELSRLRQEMIDKARRKRLSREEIEGGTFSLSNFGSYGGDFETPILNAPQSSLLGIGQIAEEPAVLGGQIVIRSTMMMSLTFDHRLIDGAVAGRFRARVRALLEQPALFLAVMR